MRLPDRLLCEIALFVSDHYNGIHLMATAGDMGVACGHQAAQWIDLAPSRSELDGMDRKELISTCERLGKHLASFYLHEREVS
jgi:hypothetical protein